MTPGQPILASSQILPIPSSHKPSSLNNHKRKNHVITHRRLSTCTSSAFKKVAKHPTSVGTRFKRPVVLRMSFGRA
jgi:hypothetical protein